MQTESEAARLRIFVDEQDRCSGKSCYELIVELVRRESLAGVTVMHGTEGAAHGGMAGIPVIVEIVDAPEEIERILPLVGEIVGEGMATIDTVRMIRYTKDGEPSRRAAVPR